MTAPVSFRAVIDKGDLQELSSRLGGMRKKIDAALKRPLNRTADKARSLMAKGITQLINIKRKDLLGTGKGKSKSALITKSAIKWQANTIVVTLPKTARPQLMFFVTKVARYRGGGVYYKIKKGGKQEFLQGAFIVKKHGVRFVTRRKGKARLPIADPLRAVSPWAVYIKNNLGPPINLELTGYLKKEVRAAINNVIRKQNKK